MRIDDGVEDRDNEDSESDDGENDTSIESVTQEEMPGDISLSDIEIEDLENILKQPNVNYLSYNGKCSFYFTLLAIKDIFIICEGCRC